MASRKQLVSVNVGRPREIEWKGRRITTSIFKEPVVGAVGGAVVRAVAVGRLNLGGDQQADLRVHGGRDKAVYVYPAEHYDYWRAELPGKPLPFGMFGENLTTEGLLEASVHIGDRLRIGTAEFQVTSPRVPCYKLEAKFERDDMIKRFLAARRSGFYLAVLEEGEVKAGDVIEVIERGADSVTVSDVAWLYTDGNGDIEGLRRAAQASALPENWRANFRKRVEKLGAKGADTRNR